MNATGIFIVPLLAGVHAYVCVHAGKGLGYKIHWKFYHVYGVSLSVGSANIYHCTC